MKAYLYKILVFAFLYVTTIFPQIDSAQNYPLVFAPRVQSVKVNFTLLLIVTQIGGEFDFNFGKFQNWQTYVGTRIGIEHYYINNFIDGSFGKFPATNYNLYARLTKLTEIISASILGGATYYLADYKGADHSLNGLLFRIGLR